MRFALLVSGTLLALAVAGCLGSDDPDEAATKVDRTIAGEAEFVVDFTHDHRETAAHAFSRNLNRIAYHNGVDASGDPDAIETGTYYTELALDGPYVYLARQTTITPNTFDEEHNGGFVIIDVSDAADPFLVGEYHALGGGDIEVSADGDLVFFATQRNTIEEMTGHLNAHQQDARPLPRGIHVVDVSDPTAPVLVFFQPLPVNGPHTLTAFEHRGAQYLSVQTYDLLTEPGGQLQVVPITQRLIIYQVTSDPVLGNVGLFPVAQFQITASAPQTKMYFPHDAVPALHPFDGRLLHYVAYWDKGVQILDIDNLPDVEAGPASSPPAALQVVGEYTVFNPSNWNNIHLAKPFDDLIDGMHVTVAEPEIISAEETGYITFIDTSDPARPSRLGAWTLPGDPDIKTVTNLDFSPHNFDTFDGKVVLAHNHAGLWIIDAGSKELLEEPKSVGYYLDVEPRADSPRLQPYFWGAFEQDGLIYAVDEATGLYILDYTGP